MSLKKSGASYKGLCPFHSEKTPSFHVNRDKGFFHCFGCSVGGDVIKFLELHEKIGFQDAVKQLAQRFGMSLPELEENDEQRASAAERETLLKVHEARPTWFREQLLSAAGARIRKHIADRGVTDATSDAQGLGFAPPGREGLKQALLSQGFSQATLLKAGLLVQRDDGPGDRSVPQPADDSDRPRHRVDHRVRRARAREGSAAEIPELARNADLLEEPDAVRPAPVQDRDSPERVRRAGRGLLRFRAGLSGRVPRGRVVRHGAHAAAGAAAPAVRRQRSS